MNYQKKVTMRKGKLVTSPQNHEEYSKALAEGYREFVKRPQGGSSMIHLKFFLVGDESGTVYNKEFESQEELAQYKKSMGNSLEVIDEKFYCYCGSCQQYRQNQ